MVINRNKSGSNLVEYAIPLLLVGVVFGIALYNLVDSGSLQKFIEGSTSGSVDTNGTLIVN